jgi:hypothetical protein
LGLDGTYQFGVLTSFAPDGAEALVRVPSSSQYKFARDGYPT